MRTKRIQLAEMLPYMVEKLDAQGQVIFTVAGRSMMPTLRDRQDRACIVGAPDCLSKYDMPLYIRDSGQYVLHRVVKISIDGTYVLRGDHQYFSEPGIRQDQIIGVVKGFWRGDHYISCQNPWYRLYCRIWWLFYPLRYVVLRARGLMGRLMKKTNKHS
ncbi:S24/S26 family peptidase [Eubacterium sp.]|uniref:S24/S26 family peptidase n=1 Tax=Eubacterium sp. TaxID=142586 RepID=UPI002FCB7A6A